MTRAGQGFDGVERRGLMFVLSSPSGAGKTSLVHALLAEQFEGVPATRANDRVTLLEEERITAYYGAGTLYADPTRAEPMV